MKSDHLRIWPCVIVTKSLKIALVKRCLISKFVHKNQTTLNSPFSINLAICHSNNSYDNNLISKSLEYMIHLHVENCCKTVWATLLTLSYGVGTPSYTLRRFIASVPLLLLCGIIPRQIQDISSTLVFDNAILYCYHEELSKAHQQIINPWIKQEWVLR